MSVGDVYQQTLVGELDGVEVANVFYQKITTDPGESATQEEVFEAFKNNILNEIQKFTSTEFQWECVLSRKIAPMTEPSRVFPLSEVGGVASPSLPANQVITVSHQSTPWTRFQNGRWFFTGIPKIWIESGRLVEAGANAFQDFCETVTGTFADAAVLYRIVHQSRQAETLFDVDACTIRPVPTKLRRRTKRLCSIS
jgi:hypothetical protein